MNPRYELLIEYLEEMKDKIYEDFPSFHERESNYTCDELIDDVNKIIERLEKGAI